MPDTVPGPSHALILLTSHQSPCFVEETGTQEGLAAAQGHTVSPLRQSQGLNIAIQLRASQAR